MTATTTDERDTTVTEGWLHFGFDDAGQGETCPSEYQVLTALSCPPWCELPADHDSGTNAARVHRAAVFELDARVHVSVTEHVFSGEGFPAPDVEVACDVIADAPFTRDEALAVHAALELAFVKRDEIRDMQARAMARRGEGISDLERARQAGYDAGYDDGKTLARETPSA